MLLKTIGVIIVFVVLKWLWVIFFNLSPSGIAFAIGSATYFGDTDFRNRLLKTREIAGSTN